MRLRLVLPATLAAGALVLGACSSGNHSGMDTGSGSMPMGNDGSMPMGGGGGSTTTINVPAGSAFNATDVAFAQGMIPHHAQAIEMADMALAISSNPEIEALAQQIKGAQGPEIDTMTGWLKSWNQPVPDVGKAMDQNMGDSGGMMMLGMMSETDMARMGNATGNAFDRMFLEMTVRHHEGAVEMAKKELADGKFQPTKDLAQAVITGQEAEITKMKALTSSLPA